MPTAVAGSKNVGTLSSAAISRPAALGRSLSQIRHWRELWLERWLIPQPSSGKPCAAHETRTFSPLAAVLAERTTPELQYLEAKFAGLASYGMSAKLLAEVLPLGRPLHATVLRRQVQAVA